uniref:Uncharacterized protein n=1 Tax=Rhizophora mucronata TaxID=61149 RepID=A0A2P2PEU4_RHIMU
MQLCTGLYLTRLGWEMDVTD